jgi:hypothetical protein
MTKPTSDEYKSGISETPRGVVARLKNERVDKDSGLAVNRSVVTLGIMKQAVVHFACKGGPVLLSTLGFSTSFETSSLVELGMCCLERSSVKRAMDETDINQRVALAEPLIVEAFMRSLSWAELCAGTMASATNATNASGRGFAFETCAPPVFDAAMSSLKECHGGPWRRGHSSCGVLIQPCDNDSDLATWATSSRDAKFARQVPPLATPRLQFGADLLGLVRNSAQFRWAFVQLKLAKDVKIAKAFLTVDPELLLHVKRDSKPEQIATFPEVYRAIFGVKPDGGEERDPVFRILVQCGQPTTKRPKVPQAVTAEKRRVAKKFKNDLVVYLGPNDVDSALKTSLGEKDGDEYMAVVNKLL